MADDTLTVLVAGLGYFSRFHLDAWQANPATRIVGLCDTDAGRLDAARLALDVPGSDDLGALARDTAPDIVDIVAPPPAHDALVRAALARGRTIICQKPFCTSLDEARALIDTADAAGSRIVIHENFRFQPWHREIRAFLDRGKMGRVYQGRFALRPGDGRGPDAYMNRQPAFQTMPQLLIHETGVHFIDLFRWLFGEVDSVYADLRRLNPAIRGEDAGTMILTHAGGARSVFDGNRLSDHVAANPRHTMGEMQIEGEGGLLSLDGNGRLLFRAFGAALPEEITVSAPVDPDSFGGGCVAALIDHVAHALRNNVEPENLARDYLPVMRIAEAAYQSHAEGRKIVL